MDQNPYAPPRSSLDDPNAVRALTAEQESQAMRALGQRRTKAKTRSFGVAWMVFASLLMLVTGLIPALLVGAVIAGAISTFYVKARKQAMSEAVCRELGLSPQAFSPDRYLID